MGNSFEQKSNETWKEGIECLDAGKSNMAANRLYYAVIQSIKGFAVANGRWVPDEKDGVHSKALDVVCDRVKKGKSWGSRMKLQELRGLREMADYHPGTVDIEELKALVEVVDFIRQQHIATAV